MGTDIPVFQTHAININGSQQGIYSWSSTATTAATQIFLKSKSNTIGTRGIVGINDTVGAIRFAGDDGAAFIESASITSEIDATPGTNDMPGRLIFSTTADGTAAPTERMRITNDGRVGIGGSPGTSFSVVNSKAITGATTQVGYGLSATIASDVTTLVAGYRSLLATQAAAFTLPSLYYYEAIQGTFGATSVVTNQYGFVAGNTLTGATNNYGFYSNIASGTSRVISFVERTTNVVTITTTVAHGYTAGQSVTVAATTNTGVNGTFTITNVPAATTFTYAQTAATIVLVADTGSTIVVGRYNFYANGTAPSYFGGRIGVGTTTPVVNLEVVDAGAGTIVARGSTTTSSSFVGALAHDYYSLPSYRGTYLNQYSSAATGTTFGLANANLGYLAFQNTSNALIYTNGTTPIVFATASVDRGRVSGTGVWSFGAAPGTESLRVLPVASAVNYLEVSGSAADIEVQIAAAGSSTIIPIRYITKGFGSHQFLAESGGNPQFEIAAATSAVNYLSVTGASTNYGPKLSAVGSDTVISLNYVTKGTGQHIFRNESSETLFVVSTSALGYNTDYLEVASSTGSASINAVGSSSDVALLLNSKGTSNVCISTGNGTTPQFVVSHTASSVNWLQATGSAGTTPTLSSQGADADINLILTPKGTGKVGIGTTAPTEKLHVSGNIIAGGSTGFTSTTNSGAAAITGIGIFPFTTPGGTTNSTLYGTIFAQNNTEFVGTNGASSQTYASVSSTPNISNSGAGGASATSSYSFHAYPTIQSSGSTARLTQIGSYNIIRRDNVNDTSTNSNNSVWGGAFYVGHESTLPTTASTRNVFGTYVVAANKSGITTDIRAHDATVQVGLTSINASATTAAGFYLNSFAVGSASTNTATVASGFGLRLAGPAVNTTGTITDYYAVYAGAKTGTGIITNNYGVYIADTTATNVFAGTTSIGGLVGSESLRVTRVASSVSYLDVAGSTGTAPTLSAQGSGTDINLVLSAKGTGFIRATSQVIVGRNYTGNESIGIGGSTTFAVATSATGIYNDINIDSTKTVGYTGFGTYVSTAAAAFNVSTLSHYSAGFFTLGAGSSIANQYGFRADGTLTTATNNYGFHSGIASGTTRTITFVERTTNVVTITTSVAHGYTLGQSVTVAATTNTSVNGTFTIASVPTTTTFTYAQTAATIVLVADTGSTIVVGRYNFYANGTAPNYFAGNVGIGTTSPEVILHAVGDVIQQTFLNGRLSSFFQSRKARGTISSPTAVISGDTIGGMLGVGYDGTAYRSTAAVSFYADGAVSTSNVPQAITFSTGTTNFYSERMRIASTGTISLGAVLGTESLRVTPVTSAVNFLEIKGAATNTAPEIIAGGSNSDIGIKLTPKGTGKVDVSGAVITGLGTPAAATDATTKQYVDGVAATLEPKLGLPAANGYILTSDTSGTRTWVNPSAPTEGTDIDQITTITKSLTLTTDWQDTGIKSTNLATGTYIVQLIANDVGAGGTNNNEYYSGTMSWYSGDTDSALELPTDEIVLHRAGGSGDGALYLRTYRTPTIDINNLKLQIYSNTANASAANYVFKFRRII